jgi:hypothetical protein
MQSHKKLLLLVFTIVSYVSAASVTAMVNTQEVVKGNAVQFTIEASGGSAAFPNIRAINGVGVTDSGTSTSTSMSITANGMKRESKTTRRYIFMPEKDMVIPSYTVQVGSENFKTKPIEIKVVKSNAPTMRTNDDYSFVMQSSKDSIVVGESFIVTLYLSLADRLGVQQVSEYIEPASTGFFFKDLGKQKQYKRGNANVIEKQYSVTSKQEGNFTISSASAKVGITDRSRQDLFGRYGIRWIGVTSDVLKVEVKALKTEADLVGDFTMESKIDKQKAKVNKPVNLTVQIRGTGNLEDFEFPKYEIDAVTIYEDEAKIESHIDNGILLSTYSKNFVFISEESFSIPKRTISVYSTNSKEIEILEVPSYEVDIEKRRTISNILPKMKTKPSPINDDNMTKAKEQSFVNSDKVIPWWMLLVAFILGMLVMYLLRFMPQLFGPRDNPYKESEALKILYVHISENKAVEEMVHKLYARKNGDMSVQIDKKELKALVERFR